MENVLVKIDKFVFLCDFVVIDMPEILGEITILGKPFLATIHAQIDVFNREISFGIGEDRVKFDVNGNAHHSNVTLEKVYMAAEKESFNPLEIEDDLFLYESPTCLRFEQNTRTHTNSNIETIDSPSNMQETNKRCADLQPDNKRDTSRWHVCKHVRVFYDDGSGEDCGIWPICNPDLSFCSGYGAVYGKGKKGYVIDDVWEKCEQNHGGTTYAWHDEGHEEEELWKCGIEKAEYVPPIVNVETFEVKRYSFMGGGSFIYITKQFDDALPLGRAKWS
ncbi:RNA-directed DNA polymerase, eukaryota, reverse transcriptase zinc-binding domain protein [Tanacetum coccineum]|uniref:RNA-directed DNA polymerase, eukaryota, reverse transcriptase zinc-binding domain protein n=1 Tax=Tanacetum coccineum TaxID=301880 RepID=A0ABQ5CVZ6_9ASTR